MYGSRIYNGCLFFIANLLISLKYGGKSGKIAPQLASANCGVYSTEDIDMGEEIKPSGVPERMLQTVYARAKESRGRIRRDNEPRCCQAIQGKVH